MINTGIKGSFETVVGDEFSAKALGSGTMDVLGTPGLAAFAERCMWESVAGFLGEGEATVGISLELKHISATPVGRKVRIESELIDIAERRLRFSFKAYDEAGLIGEGNHERFIVTKEKFLKKANEKYNA